MKRRYKMLGQCPNCLTGKKTYELDKKSPFCPYINCYKAKEHKCGFFVDMNAKKGGILSRIFKLANVTPPRKIAV